MAEREQTGPVERTTRAALYGGASALLLGVGLAVAGVLAYGSNMTANLLAGFAGAAVEIAVAVLIIDRVTAARRRRQWAFAYDAMSDRLAVTFVDVMRILWIKFSEAAAAVNEERMPYFEQLAHLHLAELRSNIEGFATALEPRSHDLCRRVDRRLSWAIAQMIELPSGSVRQREMVGLMRETGELLIEFLELGGGPRYRAGRCYRQPGIAPGRGVVDRPVCGWCVPSAATGPGSVAGLATGQSAAAV